MSPKVCKDFEILSGSKATGLPSGQLNLPSKFSISCLALLFVLSANSVKLSKEVFATEASISFLICFAKIASDVILRIWLIERFLPAALILLCTKEFCLSQYVSGTIVCPLKTTSSLELKLFPNSASNSALSDL